MSTLFLKVLNLSIAASWLILAVVVIRLFLKNAPKWIRCVLWALVAFRLACPVTIESPICLVPSNETIPYDIAMKTKPMIDSGIKAVDQVVNPVVAYSFAPNPLTSANPLQIVIPIVALVWIVGMLLMLLYALFSSIKLKMSVGASIFIGKNILACDDVKSPFILGIFRPLIYVPSYMTGDTLDFVITHERTHIKRHDHWWKPLGYLLLAVYWFHPLCWIAYTLFCRDIEMACDEKVIQNMDKDGKAAYSQALLNCNFPRKRIVVCPLAFGEVGVKERVRSVLNYKKPAFWVVVIAVIACVVVAVCFLTNPKEEERTSPSTMQATVIKIENGTMLVTPVKGSWELNSSDEFAINIKSMEASPEPKSGDIVEIIYEGGIQETYPASLENIMRITVVGRDNDTKKTDDIELTDAEEKIEPQDSKFEVLQGTELLDYLAAMPDDVEELAETGTFVLAKNGNCYGMNYLSEFLTLYYSEQPTAITIGQYTTEGDLILDYVAYDGKKITVTYDSRRDTFADPSMLISTEAYDYFSIFEWKGESDRITYEDMVAHNDPELTHEKMFEMMISSQFTPGQKKQFALLGTFANGSSDKADALPVSDTGFSPEDIKSIVRIDLQLTKDDIYSVTDINCLQKVEEMLSSATEMYETGCSFHTPMYLTRTDGTVGVIYPATDSCDVFYSDGKYYDYGDSDNVEFWSLLGLETDLGDVYRKQ